MAISVERSSDVHAWQPAIYGTISIAVVVAQYGGKDEERLSAIIAGYAVSIYLAHMFSVLVTSEERSWRRAAAISSPVIESALPALVTAFIGRLAGWSIDTIEVLALVACLANVVLIQVLMLRRTEMTTRRIGLTAIGDLLIGLVVVAVAAWAR